MTAQAIRIVGMQAGGRQHIVKDCRIKHPAMLIPEPDNAYDPNAIAVYSTPTHLLTEPGLIVSSVADPDRVGSISKTDRETMLERQVGYVPKEIAARLNLPVRGVVGWVSNVRVAPPEYLLDGSLSPEVVVGLDVTAWIEGDAQPPEGPDRIAEAIDDHGKLDPDFSACDRVGHAYISSLTGGALVCRRCQVTKQADAPTGTPYELNYPIGELRRMATDRGLSPDGTKQELDARLNAHDKATS